VPSFPCQPEIRSTLRPAADCRLLRAGFRLSANRQPVIVKSVFPVVVTLVVSNVGHTMACPLSVRMNMTSGEQLGGRQAIVKGGHASRLRSRSLSTLLLVIYHPSVVTVCRFNRGECPGRAMPILRCQLPVGPKSSIDNRQSAVLFTRHLSLVTVLNPKAFLTRKPRRLEVSACHWPHPGPGWEVGIPLNGLRASPE
jgi:hypothetical protein